jgi:hypothetical protein
MKAILKTRCGCERVMTVTYPPPPIIQIPLMELDATFRVNLGKRGHELVDAAEPTEIRTFERDERDGEYGIRGTQIYYEAKP